MYMMMLYVLQRAAAKKSFFIILDAPYEDPVSPDSIVLDMKVHDLRVSCGMLRY